MRRLATTVAAVALAATSAFAQQGAANGNAQRDESAAPGKAAAQGGTPRADAAEKPGNGKAEATTSGNGRGPPALAEQTPPNNNRSSPSQESAGRQNGNGDGNGNGNGNGNGKAQSTGDKSGKPVRRTTSEGANGSSPPPVRSAGTPRATENRPAAPLRSFSQWARASRDRGLIKGCPPGLARKRNGCSAPGLGGRSDLPYDQADWWSLPGLREGRYRYYRGNLVTLSDAGSISGYYPLLAGGLSVGGIWPDWFGSRPLSPYYESFYALSGDNYRYADNTIYRIDPDTGAITAIAALLTGNDIEVGEPMPPGYEVYNLPIAYRDRYSDGPDAYYRYSDGYIYEVNPATRLVRAAVELLL